MKQYFLNIILINLLFIHSGFNDVKPFEDVILLTISWNDNYHGDEKYYYIMRETSNENLGPDKIKLSNSTYRIIPIKSPRYPDELLACCEMKDINYLLASSRNNLVDSLGDKYKNEFNRNQLTEKNIAKLIGKKQLKFQNLINGKEINIFLNKVKANFCMCKSAYNNPGSELVDSVACLKEIKLGNKFSKGDKAILEDDLKILLSNSIVKEALPQPN